MASQPSFAAEQLLELLLQLKKTTPAAARQILNSQPAIAYALITLMVTMNAVNIDVFQKTLADHAEQRSSVPQPFSNGHSLPQSYPQPPPNGSYSQPSSAYSYNQPYQAYPQQYGGPPTQPVPTPLSDPLAAFPEDQKALIMRVLSMTPEQINALPATERSAYIQLRATLGVPTG